MIKTRLKLLLLAPPLALDSFLNWLCGGSIGSTLSSEAWRQREHPRWGWTHRMIDWLAKCDGPNHCERAAKREDTYGSVWAGWLADFKGQA